MDSSVLNEPVDEANSENIYETIDDLVMTASAATDAGNYSDALEGFRLALKLTQVHFGGQEDVSGLGGIITEIEALLNDASEGPIVPGK